MTLADKLRADLAEAVDWSNWYFEDQNWDMAERWHFVAVQIQGELDYELELLAAGQGRRLTS